MVSEYPVSSQNVKRVTRACSRRTSGTALVDRAEIEGDSFLICDEAETSVEILDVQNHAIPISVELSKTVRPESVGRR